MASEALIICGTIGMIFSPDEFTGGMIILGVVGAIIRYDDVISVLKSKIS